MPIFVQRGGNKVLPLEKTGFPQELDLQEFFFRHPQALALGELGEETHLLALDREFPTPTGAVDLLVVDGEGNLYLVETKLFRNPDKRQVVAQVLDYGAALWGEYGDDPDAFLKTLEARLATAGGLVNRLAEVFEEPEGVLQGMRDSVSTGNFRFVVIMDSVPDELKRMVEYLNRLSRFTLYAVEVEHYVLPGEDLHIYVQNVHGYAPKFSASRARTLWDEARYFQHLSERAGPSVVEAVRKLVDFAKNQGAVIEGWGTGRHRGSFAPKFPLKPTGRATPFLIYSDGMLQIPFGLSSMREYLPLWKEHLRRCLARVPIFTELLHEPLEELRFPQFSAEVWVPHVDAIIEALRVFLTTWPPAEVEA